MPVRILEFYVELNHHKFLGQVGLFPILQLKKQKLGCPLAGRGQSWDLNPGLSDFNACTFL